MANQYRNYTDEDIKQAVTNNKSIAGVLKELGLKIAGGNYANMKRNLQRLNLDTSHWTGQAWNRGERTKDWSDYTRASKLKPHLIKEQGHKCDCCGGTRWLNHKIPLEIHHVDTDRTNNKLENLRLLCSNCHALTEGYRNRK